MMTLKEYLETHKHSGFIKRIRDYGTHLSYFAAEDRCLAEQIDETLTIYRSVETNEIVGIRLWK